MENKNDLPLTSLVSYGEFKRISRKIFENEVLHYKEEYELLKTKIAPFNGEVPKEKHYLTCSSQL